MNRRAFTLVELLIVVAMVVILFIAIFNLASGCNSGVPLQHRLHINSNVFEPMCRLCIEWKNKNLADQMKSNNLSDERTRKAVENSQ